jgi:hypothetical protein
MTMSQAAQTIWWILHWPLQKGVGAKRKLWQKLPYIFCQPIVIAPWDTRTHYLQSKNRGASSRVPNGMLVGNCTFLSLPIGHILWEISVQIDGECLLRHILRHASFGRIRPPNSRKLQIAQTRSRNSNTGMEDLMRVLRVLSYLTMQRWCIKSYLI